MVCLTSSRALAGTVTVLEQAPRTVIRAIGTGPSRGCAIIPYTRISSHARTVQQQRYTPANLMLMDQIRGKMAAD